MVLLRTVCADALQHIGRHYDLHNLYGWSQVRSIFKRVYLHPVGANPGGCPFSTWNSRPHSLKVCFNCRLTTPDPGRPFLGRGDGLPTGLGITGACGATSTTPSLECSRLNPILRLNLAPSVQSVWDPISGRRHMWLQWDHEPRDVHQVSDWCHVQETLLIQVASAGGLLSFCKESQCCRHVCILNTDINNSHVIISTPHSGMIAQDPASLGEEAASLIRWQLP